MIKREFRNVEGHRRIYSFTGPANYLESLAVTMKQQGEQRVMNSIEKTTKGAKIVYERVSICQ